MASKFTITAELNLQTKNLNQVVNNLRQQFQGANLNIKIKDLAQAQAQLNKISSSAQNAQKSVGLLGSSFGQAFRRFTVVTAVTGTIVGFTRALKNAVTDAIEFEREVVKIAQATGKTTAQLKGLTTEISNVSSSFGVSSKELILAARSLTQAGFAADKVTDALKILAQTELAATFDSIQDTTEGAIALLNQFGRQAQKAGSEVAFLEKSFSAINQVSKEFAVESSDLVTAIRTTGSAFESAGGSLDELLALFTSVRATTRESAESIATGFRTIFTRVQRVDTINNLKALGIQLQDAEGKFIGPIEATKRLSTALNSIDPRDFRFNLVVEELGGFRQVSKVIPLIQQFAVTQKALNVAQGSSGSLAKDAQTAQQSLAVQIAKTREEFSRFIRDLTGTESFQNTVRFLLDLANAFIKVADSIKPLVPLIAGFATFKAGTAVKGAFDQLGGARKKNQGGVIGFASGGLVPGSGNGDTVPAMLTPGEFVIRKSSVKKLGIENLAKANKYASGGEIMKEDTIGAAILQPGVHSTSQFKIDDKKTQKQISDATGIPTKQLSLKSWKIEKEGLSPETFKKFRRAVEFGLKTGLEAAVSKSQDFTGISPIKLTDENRKNFLNTINEGAYGNMFEQILTFAKDKGQFDGSADPKRPFDFYNGLPDLLGNDFSKLKGIKYIDAKASLKAASGVGQKIIRELLYKPGSFKSSRYLQKEYKAAINKNRKAAESLTSRANVTNQQAIMGSLKEMAFEKYSKNLDDKGKIRKIPGMVLSGITSKGQLNSEVVGVINKKIASDGINIEDLSDVLSREKFLKDALGFAKGGSVAGLTEIPWMASGGSIPKAPLVDDILQASGAILPNPKTAISQIKQAGGAALDMDRTLLRTIGDLAYGKAKTPEEKLAVLKKYFFDDAARLKDVKTAKLTQFGMALQKAIKNKEIDPKNLSIISKSDRTPGLPEFLQSLFGISTVNMVFTGGKNKQPALDIFREKGAFFASGGLANGTDTVPAMLTPGEFVVNRKSAQRIGYGALNRMNKVGKYANGGVVQMYNAGTPTGGASAGYTFTASTANPTPAPSVNIDVLSSALEQSAKEITEKGKKVGDGLSISYDKLLLFGSAASSVISQMGIFNQKTADIVSSLTGTFATVQGIGGNLINFSSQFKVVKDNPKILAGLNAGLTGFAAAQAVAAARITYLGQSAEDSGKKVDSFIDALSKGEGTSQGQITEALTKQFQAASDAQARGSSGAKTAGAVGALAAGGIATALGAGAFAPIIASVAAPLIEEGLYQLGAFSESADKAKTQADALGAAMFSATNSSRDFQKFFKDIEKQSPEDVTKQAQSLARAYKEQQAQIIKLGDLSNASEAVKKRFEAVSEAAKQTANNLQTIIGVQLQGAIKRSSDLLNRGFVPDTDKLLKPVFASIASDIESKYVGQIRNAGGENTQAGQAIVQERNNELAKAQNEARKRFDEAAKQQLEMIAVLNIENNIRKDLIGSLQKQSAISASIERLSYELDLASKSVSNIDAAFSGSITGLKSVFDTDILKLKSPDQDKLSKALDPVKAIGPIGKDLADNILNINEVMPNLEAKLIQFSTATDTVSGALFDVKKFVEQSFNIKGDSIVGKTLIKLIEGTTTGTGGEKAVTAAKTSLRQEDVRKKIVESFQKFGEEFRTQASGILENFARVEQEGRAIGEKINESRQKQLELQMQGIDTFSNYIDALARARGRDLSLLEKNNIRNMKQYALAGNMANNIGAISSELSGIYKNLSEGGLKLDQQRDLSFSASKLKSALEDLADQSGKTSDILAEIEKVRSRREAGREFGKEFTFGSNEQRQSIANSIQGLQRVFATGNIDSIPEELRSGVSSLLDRFKDVPVFNGMTGKQVENKLIANQFRAMGAGGFANMIEADSSTPEQILIGELQRTFAIQLQAQQALSQLEQQKQDALQTSLGGYTDSINSYTAKLEALVQEFQRKAEEKAIPVTRDPLLDFGVIDNGMMNEQGQLIFPQAVPQDAKSKIDIENIQQINETIKTFDNSIDASAKKIDELTLRLENFTKVLQNTKKEQPTTFDLIKAGTAGAMESKIGNSSIGSIGKLILNPFGIGVESAQTFQKDLEQFRSNIKTNFNIRNQLQRKNQQKSLGGLIYRAGGGSIFQPKGTDTVPAMLTPGEFVIKKSSVDKIGVDNLKALNNGYANGGLVSYLAGGGSASAFNSLNDLVKKVSQLEERVKKLEDENKVLKGKLGQVQIAGGIQNMQQMMGAMTPQPVGVGFGMQMPMMGSRVRARQAAQRRATFVGPPEQKLGIQQLPENFVGPLSPQQTREQAAIAAINKQKIVDLERSNEGQYLASKAADAGRITPEMQKAKIEQLTAENKARVEKQRAEVERNRLPSLEEIANIASSPITSYERKPQDTPEQKAIKAAEFKAKAMADIDAKYVERSTNIDKEMSDVMARAKLAGEKAAAEGMANQRREDIAAYHMREGSSAGPKDSYSESSLVNPVTLDSVLKQMNLSEKYDEITKITNQKISDQKERQKRLENLTRPSMIDAEGNYDFSQDPLVRGISDSFYNSGPLAILSDLNREKQAGTGIQNDIQNSQLADEGRIIKKNMNLRQQLQGFASGGSTDTVPAMLTPGEFVMNKDAVSKYGKSFMEKMNRGGVVPGFADGGYVGYYASGGFAIQQNRLANQFANNPMVQQGIMANPMAMTQQAIPQTGGGGNAAGAVGGGMADAAQQFSQFVTQFSDAAKMMTGMTMTHKVTIDGQVNIGGIDGPGIANAIKESIGSYIKEQVESIMNKNNNKVG